MDVVSLTLDLHPDGSVMPSFLWPSSDANGPTEGDFLRGVQRLADSREQLIRAVDQALGQVVRSAQQHQLRHPLQPQA